jgi:penicillin-binding protein-related factor A (putative recombinase)
MIHDDLGKKAEQKIRQWLDVPSAGYCFDRIPDQLSGLYGSKNICDFTMFKYPYMYYIESKATWSDRFDFSMISDYQYKNLLSKSRINGVYGVIIVLFAEVQRAFIIDINEIDRLMQSGKKSLNIKKINKWGITYTEIQTIPSRKALLDYTGEFCVNCSKEGC